MPRDQATYVCAGCGETYAYGDHDLAEAEAARNNIDPDECVVVCDGCFDIAMDLSDGKIVVGPALN